MSGSREPLREVREVLEVFESGAPERVMLCAEKRAEEGARSGGMQAHLPSATFTIRLPHGLAPGSYPARTTLYVNGRPAGENGGAIRVVGAASPA